jgi:hypothetical protein
MKGLEDVNLSDEGRSAKRREAQQPRAVGAPLPIGGPGRGGFSQAAGDARHPAPPPPGRALSNAQDNASVEQLSSAQRAMNVLKMAMPLVQRILPLLDGNFGTAISNVLAPQMHKPAPPVNVNLAPIEQGLAELKTQQRDLRDQVVEQNTSLKRVEDHLEMVREATDRNTLEQQELLEDLKAVGNKVNLVAIIALGLLAVSVFLNLFLYLHIERVLP